MDCCPECKGKVTPDHESYVLVCEKCGPIIPCSFCGKNIKGICPLYGLQICPDCLKAMTCPFCGDSMRFTDEGTDPWICERCQVEAPYKTWMAIKALLEYVKSDARYHLGDIQMRTIFKLISKLSEQIALQSWNEKSDEHFQKEQNRKQQYEYELSKQKKGSDEVF